MTPGGTVTVYVPCDVVTVQVRLGFDEAVSPVERIVLRAVHAGAGTLAELADVLGLSSRLTLDVVQDLWHAGYLRLVRTRGGVKVTDAVARHITEGTLDGLRASETVDGTRQVMIDKLSGHLMPAAGGRVPDERRLAVPVDNRQIRITDAPVTDLLDAIARSVAEENRDRQADPEQRQRGGATRSRRLLSARLSPNQIATSGRRWLPVDVRVSVDPDSDRLVVTAVGDALPPSRRHAASQTLTLLAEQHPKTEFAQALRGRAAPGLVDAPSLATSVARLREQAETGATIPAGQRRNWHLSLCDLAGRLSGVFDDQVDREVTVRVLDAPDQVAALRELIRSAMLQLVLTGPWVTYRALAALEPDLRNALERGVQVVLLWGIAYDQRLDEADRVENLLYSLTLDATGAPTFAPRLLVPRTSSRTHAKVAVADDHTALVTSWNMLSREEPVSEVGVRVATPGGGSCRTVRDLLVWSRRAVPGYDMSRALLVTEQDFALRHVPNDRHRPAAGREPAMPRDTFVPPPEPSDDEGEAALGSAAAWSRSWVELADRVAAHVAARVHPAAQIVVDGTHRDVLRHAMRSARRRLVVTSDQLGSQVVDDRFAAAVRELLDRGVEVTLIYGRLQDGEEAATSRGSLRTGIERTLQNLARSPLMQVVHDENHAKVLVWDDEVLIASFNFMSFDGQYASSPAHKQRSEIGLRLTGRAVADDAVRALGLRAETGRAPEPERPEPPPADRAFLAAQLLLNEVAAGAAPADAVDRHLVGDTAWEILDRLVGIAGRDVLRCVVAVCLDRFADQARPVRRGRWIRWLVEDLWADGCDVEAMLLRTAVADGWFRPRPTLTVLAAARGGPHAAQAMERALVLLDPPTPDGPVGELRDLWVAERTAVVAVALEQALLDVGGGTASFVLECERAVEGDDALDPAWVDVVEATLVYADATDGHPLPLGMIRADLYGRRDAEARAEAWADLETALARAEGTNLDNTASLRTHMYLFTRPEGAFARLKAAAAERDADAVRAWLASVDHRNPGQLINAAAAVAAPGQTPMYGTYRKRYVRLLLKISDNAGQVVRLAALGTSERDAGDGSLAHPSGILADALALRWDDLLEQAELMTGPERRLVDAVLDRLQEVRSWAQQRSVTGPRRGTGAPR